MDLSIEPTRRYTVAEYVAIDEASEIKYEFRDGEIIAMSGALFEHVQISSNLNRHLGNRLAGTLCQALNSDLRVRALRNRRYCYPDVTVVCGPPAFDPPDRRVTVVNPRVVFEVLSESTEASDRGEKFTRYRQAESLLEYVLVAQDRPQVEPFYLGTDGVWSIGQVIDGLDGVVHLRSLGIDLPLAEIYERVTFPPLPPEPDQPD
jgi:Uma2 family endonuclease